MHSSRARIINILESYPSINTGNPEVELENTHQQKHVLS
jgi:hypothetical protein